RIAVPERRQADVLGHADVIAQAEQQAEAGLRLAEERHPADACAASDEETVGARGIEADACVVEAHVKALAFDTLREPCRAECDQEPVVDRAPGGDVATEAALAASAVLTPKRAVAKARVEPEAATGVFRRFGPFHRERRGLCRGAGCDLRECRRGDEQ